MTKKLQYKVERLGLAAFKVTHPKGFRMGENGYMTGQWNVQVSHFGYLCDCGLSLSIHKNPTCAHEKAVAANLEVK